MPRKGTTDNTDVPVGTTRIYKVDSRNFAIQQLRELKRTQDTRKEWVDLGYTADNWKHLLGMCLTHGVPDGEVTVQAIRDAQKAIEKACREALA